MNNFLIIIDGTNLLNRCYYASPYQRYHNNKPISAVEGFLKYVLGILKRQSPSHIAFCFDTGSRKTFRKNMYDGYKEGRKDSPSDLISQYEVIENILTNIGLPVFVSDRKDSIENIWEGDDYCGTIAKKMRYKIPEIVLITKDHDYLQLLDSSYDEKGNFCNTVVWMNTSKAGEYFRECGIKSVPRALPYNTFEYTSEYYYKLNNMMPSQVIEYKAIVGDSSDSIPGVPGVGHKMGVALLSKYKNIEDLYEDLKTLKEDTIVSDWKNNLGIKNAKSLRRKLIEGESMAYLSRDLGTIKTDIPIDVTIDDLKIDLDISSWNNEVRKLGLYNLVINK